MLLCYFYFIFEGDSLFYGSVYFFYFISFCYSLFCGSVSFSLYFFSLFYSISLISFLFRWFFSASASKTSKGSFTEVFIIKNKGGWEFIHWGSNHKKKE